MDLYTSFAFSDNLVLLDLSHNGYGEQFPHEPIYNLIFKCKQLRELQFKDNPIESADGGKFVDALRWNKSLLTFDYEATELLPE